jgi:hypothetical protein
MLIGIGFNDTEPYREVRKSINENAVLTLGR